MDKIGRRTRLHVKIFCLHVKHEVLTIFFVFYIAEKNKREKKEDIKV